jgi:hypothetical protein
MRLTGQVRRGPARAVCAVVAVALSVASLLAAAGSGASLATVPFLQQGAKLTGGGAVGGSRFGASVSVSGDGKIALVGGPDDDGRKGAVWIFTRSGSTWEQLGVKLTGDGETGAGRFGSSVALSPDGNTALIGGDSDDGGKGAVWVFTRAGSAWSQQGGKLTGAGAAGKAQLGISVAVSADGNTALAGGYLDNNLKGAAWVFTRSGATWSQQGNKLTGAGGVGVGQLGIDVALSADGNTALAGGSVDDAGKGAAWVFTRSGSTWAQQGGKLTGGGAVGAGVFGSSVALSAAGDTALVGGFFDGGKGAAWAFTRSGAAWSQQGGKLTAVDEIGSGRFGNSVGLSADGKSAFVGGTTDDGGQGAAWSFARSGSTWSQQGDKLTGSGVTGTAEFGHDVALSADGRIALAGGQLDASGKGAAWVFSNAAPAVSALTPASGPAAGGTLVKITGTNLAGATAVKFGSTPATLTKVISDTELSAVAPLGAVGTVDVTVTRPTGTSAANAAARFTYTSHTAKPATTAQLNARIVFATVTGHGKDRILRVRIRISVRAIATLRLLAHGVPQLTKAFQVKGGANELKAAIPSRATKGTRQVKVTLVDGKGNRRSYTAGVPVPG